jgi:hypothetical protein
MVDKQATSSFTLQIPDETLDRVDKHAERLGARGVKISRAEALRNALDRGLSEAERRSGTTRGETGAATPKTRRGE